jgi:putative ABC transport system permease protein
VSARYRIIARVFMVEAFRALGRHKVRSALTTLGITIGIAAVVWVVAIGQAGSERTEAQLQSLGDNLIWVEAGSRNRNGVRTGTRGMNTLTLEDGEAILREIPTIKSMSPNVDGRLVAVWGNRNWTTSYRGVTASYFGIKRWRLRAGEFFGPEDDTAGASVCVIGQTVREQLFGDDNPIGQTIRIGTQLFRVVGVLAPKGQTPTGQDQDDTIIMPYKAAVRRIKGAAVSWLDDILLSAVSPDAVDPSAAAIVALMRQRHRLADADDDFNIRRPQDVINAQIEASHTLALLLISVASVSLLVGGVGIMNVMLASVLERTREIGLRLAVGAPDWAVHAQFLGEAVLLSVTGGVCGILVSLAGSYLFERTVEWQLALSAQAIALALGFSIAVGVFFGFYPARRAARMDPIDALRHE